MYAGYWSVRMCHITVYTPPHYNGQLEHMCVLVLPLSMRMVGGFYSPLLFLFVFCVLHLELVKVLLLVLS